MADISRTHTTLRNVSFGFMGYVWPMFFSLFITPFIIRGIGVAEYGVFIFIMTISGLLGLLDFGIGNAGIKFIAEYTAKDDRHTLQRFTQSFNTLIVFVGVLGLVILSGIPYLGELFTHHGVYTENFGFVFILAGILFFISTTNALYAIVPTALQRFDTTNKLNIGYVTVVNIVNLITVHYGYGLVGLYIGQIVTLTLYSLLLRYHTLQLLPHIRFRLGWAWEEVKKTYIFGVTTFFGGLANSSLTYLDKLIIPIFLNASQLTYYSLPGNITGKIPGITGSLSGILFPMASSLQSSGQHDIIKKLYVRSFRLMLVLASAISFSIIFLAEEIMLHWLGPDFAAFSTSILIIGALTNLILALSLPLTSFLIGLGKVRFITISSIIMASINIVLLFALLPSFKILGAAWAYLFSTLPVFYMFFHVETKYLHLSDRKHFYIRIFGKIAFVSLLAYPIHTFLLAPLITSLISLACIGALGVSVFLGLYYILNFFEDEDKRDIISFVTHTFKKLS